MMLVRGAAASMHNRDRLMSVAFDGIGSLPMATIDKFRDMKQVGAAGFSAGRLEETGT